MNAIAIISAQETPFPPHYDPLASCLASEKKDSPKQNDAFERNAYDWCVSTLRDLYMKVVWSDEVGDILTLELLTEEDFTPFCVCRPLIEVIHAVFVDPLLIYHGINGIVQVSVVHNVGSEPTVREGLLETSTD